MREQRLKRILLLSGALLAVVTLLGACSTKTPTAPLQEGGTVVSLPDAQPTADFEAEAAPGEPDLVMFTNMSTNAASLFWEFGDGATSRGENPVHRYARFGTYTVRLTATNGSLNDSISKFLKVGVDIVEPTALITIKDQNGLTVIFSAESCAECRYSWEFGDGSTSSEKDPVHAYGRAGTYTVSLTARNGAGSDTDSVFVTVPMEEAPPEATLPVASFSLAINGLTIAFTNNSQSATSYLWTFGDGASSTAENPADHTYAAAGTYSVSLAATNDSGTDNATQIITVNP